ASAEGKRLDVKDAPKRGRRRGPDADEPASTAERNLAWWTFGRPADLRPIEVRDEPGAPVLFSPSVAIDASGHAAVEVTLPDAAARYRVTVVAVSGDERFGAGEATLAAAVSLPVRPDQAR